MTSPVYTIKPIAGPPACAQQSPDRELLLGLAVSGGGSRAALFAASAYEALGHMRIGPENRSLLEQVSHISSVSGGSLASAYYTMKKPAREVPMLTPDGQLTEANKVFFTEFKKMMARDYERPLFWRNLLRLRWINPSWTAMSLKEVLQDSYIGDASFRELAQRQARGDSPYFLINTTLYNDGRRLVLSSLDRDALRYDLVRDLKKNPGVGESESGGRADSVHKLGPDSDSDSGRSPLSTVAVVVG